MFATCFMMILYGMFWILTSKHSDLLSIRQSLRITEKLYIDIVSHEYRLRRFSELSPVVKRFADFLHSISISARKRGFPVKEAYEELINILRHIEESYRARSAWIELYRYRSLFVVAILALGRILLISIKSDTAEDGLLDLISVGIGVGILGLGFLGLGTFLPRTVFWDLSFSELSKKWFYCFVFLRQIKSFAEANELGSLVHEENKTGADLSRVKKDFLKSSLRRIVQKEMMQINKVETIYPIVELLCLGGAGISLILVPGLGLL